LHLFQVNVGSPAERAGLIAGDSVIRVNNTDVFNLRHKDAQDVIVRAGPSFDVTVQRGGSTWKPAVIPTGSLSSPKPHVPPSNVAPVTKTSLAAPKSDNWGSVGTGHNVSAKPFGGGAVNGLGPKLVNKQYNSPVNLYSEDTIAETLSAQAEVLANGVLGVNFKKNEKTYDASKSNVLRYVKEDELDPKSPEPVTRSDFYATHSHAVGGYSTPVSEHSVPVNRTGGGPTHFDNPPNSDNPAEQQVTKCSDCERVIVGVFVRIKEKNLHVECFKCSTCGTSLKNVGYYNINNKLYCDIHAKLAARSNPPASNLAPVTIPPIGRPGGGVSSLSPNSLPSSAPLSPNINSYAPPPFQTHDPYSGYVCVRSNAPGLIKTSLNSAASRKRTVTNDVSNPVKTNPFSPTTTTYIPNYAKTNIRSGPNISGPRPFSSGPLSPSGNSYSTLPKVTSTPLSSGRITSNKFGGGLFKGSGSGRQVGAIGFSPKRGRGVLNLGGGSRVPLCGHCHRNIRGPFVTALGKIWCPEHFSCATPSCKRPLQDLGFVEEQGQLYCEYCFERYLAPNCSKCGAKVKAECLKAIGKHFHPECFNCVHCGKLFGNNPFFLEDGQPYCDNDWNELFTTKCFACGFPIEAGDRWVEALSNNYHSQCFNCTMCKKNLEGQSFFAKGGRPFCKNHAR
ncbi:PDZ and LIM domain protein Zasp, partial [Agrilus planipennis]|uniref:PDZ and LIM domain protein Zasp n=1 Tax=Agrilus planipennis TaxID=224129 RepID=A0A1W4WZS0_AGRPL